MCYHASTPNSFKLQEELGKQYEIKYRADTFYHVSGFTRPFLPTTLNKVPTEVIGSQWKLLPFWVKNEEQAKKYANTLNAESESIFEKASYKNYIQKFRGLLWVDGFFEPHKNSLTGTPENYYIYKPDKGIFSIGVVYSPWVNQETGEVVNTFSVITTKANQLLEEIHNEKKRMPLIISPEAREQWLTAIRREEIQDLMVPYSGNLTAHKISTRVTADRSGNTNRPDIQGSK